MLNLGTRKTGDGHKCWQLMDSDNGAEKAVLPAPYQAHNKRVFLLKLVWLFKGNYGYKHMNYLRIFRPSITKETLVH